ncbi:DUF3572 domain-containing protein [Pontibaca salina]|uniref:DUF3572 domain-containing protein n=1 Tax=Pontibaca salina TaxID=2795731 RepID=A0A934HKS4_9RHOB|nr:DUF3572 domain-containing protein [Pontibaca salina]MBI6630004.1 DUF3572 domain-containing protein [Pontibaca salina]
MQFSADAAETFALQVLAWLVADEDLLGVFLNSSGADEDDLRTRAQDPEFLGSVLDFLMLDDAWVMRFCDTQRISYERVMQARAALPGGAQINWT